MSYNCCKCLTYGYLLLYNMIVLLFFLLCDVLPDEYEFHVRNGCVAHAYHLTLLVA